MKHETKFCPRCNVAFECKVGLIAQCQCSTVRLNDQEMDYISNRYQDCLCAKCMKELKREYLDSIP